MLRCVGIVVGFGLAVLAGCASVSFKRGASPDAMESDERACREAAADDAAFVECMRSRGWYMSGTGTQPDDLGTDVQVTKPDTQDRVPPPADNTTVPPVPVAVSLPAATASPAQPSSASPTPTGSGEPSGPAAVTLTPTPAVSSSATTASPEPVDPTSHVRVASWWKLGGSAAGLDGAINACVAELGPAHRPDPAATVVTIALRACLRSAGWYPFGSPTDAATSHVP